MRQQSRSARLFWAITMSSFSFFRASWDKKNKRKLNSFSCTRILFLPIPRVASSRKDTACVLLSAVLHSTQTNITITASRSVPFVVVFPLRGLWTCQDFWPTGLRRKRKASLVYSFTETVTSNIRNQSNATHDVVLSHPNIFPTTEFFLILITFFWNISTR